MAKSRYWALEKGESLLYGVSRIVCIPDLFEMWRLTADGCFFEI